jgi:hypothetical protein
MPLEFDLIADYFPDTVSDERTLDAYSRLQTWYASKFPDLDTRPGSVFGDMFVLPAASYLAAKEQGMASFAADLDLEGVSQGNIGRCDFVQMFLKNFGAMDNKELVSSGIMRLAFSVDVGQEVNKAILFSYHDNDYQLKLFGDPAVRVLPVGSSKESSNDYVLTQTSSTRYFVDVPVESYSQGQVLSGARFTSSVALAYNVEISAVGDFFIGAYTSSLPALARKTRETFHAASMGTKSGVIRTIKREFPDLLSVSPVIQGQAEMTRACMNQFGVAQPAADIFVKSPFYGSTIVQVVKLPYTDGKFFSEINFTHIPLTIKSVTLAGDTQALGHVLYTRSSDELTYPGLSSAYSENARYWLDIEDTDTPIGTAIDETGNPYQVFEITYTTEPYAGIVGRWLSDPQNKPIGSNFQARAAVPMVMDSMDVRFRRDRGKKFNHSQAQDEIYKYLSGLSWPSTYTDAEIFDSMYYQGASTTRGISVIGRLCFSPATKYVQGQGTTRDDIVTQAVDIPSVYLTGTPQFTTTYSDLTDGSGNLFYAASDANTAFLIDKTNINLIEI